MRDADEPRFDGDFDVLGGEFQQKRNAEKEHDHADADHGVAAEKKFPKRGKLRRRSRYCTRQRFRSEGLRLRFCHKVEFTR